MLSCDVTARAFGPVRAMQHSVMMQDCDQTGLQHAARQCWPLICAELIDRGADVMAIDKVIVML